jgi:Flp pilus assembly protein TadD
MTPNHSAPSFEIKNNGQANAPLLSICIPTFNRADFLIQCLESFVAQISEKSQKTFEIVIVDNASTDDTKPRLSPFLKYGYIRYFRNGMNKGAELNVVESVGRAKGEYVWIFGDDDLILDGALKKVLNYLSANRFDLFLTNKVVKNRDLTKTVLEKQNNTSGDIAFSDVMDLCCMFGFYTQLGFLSSIIFRRLPFSAVDPVPYINLGSCYPQNGILLEAFSRRPCLYISEPLVCQRQYNQRDDQKSGWPYFATAPLIRMFKMLASKKAIKVSSIEQIKEDPLDGRPCTLIDILLASFESIVRRGDTIPKPDWLDTMEIFSSFRTVEYTNKIASIYLEYIVKLLSSGKREEALFHSRYLVAKYPASASVNSVLGESLYHNKHFKEAGRAFHRAITLDPRQTPAYIRLAEIRWKEGVRDEATGLLEKAISLAPDNPDAIFILGSMLIESGNVEAGIRELERLAKLVPLNADVHRKLGQALYQAGQVRAAEITFLRAYALDRNSYELHNDLGVLYWEQGDRQKAIDHIRLAMQLNPENPEVLANYALIQEARGEKDQALGLPEQYSTPHKDEEMNKEIEKREKEGTRVRG